jgi:hypothetical protein
MLWKGYRGESSENADRLNGSASAKEKHSNQPYTFHPPEQEQDYLLYILFFKEINK